VQIKLIPQLEILKKEPDHITVKCLECSKNSVRVWDFYLDYVKEDINNTIQYYDQFCCDICKSYINEVINFLESEEQEIKERDQILELEYLADIRSREPKSNKIASIKVTYEHFWHTYNKKTTTKVKKYVTRCGQEYELISNTLARISEEHKKCRTCKILNGSSKATKLNDSELLNIWEKTVKAPYTLESRNYKYEDNCLYHRSDLEFIKRKKDKLIINNSQEIHFNSGYFGRSVCCPRFWNIASDKMIRLPLNAIRDQVYSDVKPIDLKQIVEKIELIDYKKDFWKNGILFKANNKYCWFKRDEAQECLIILPCKVTNTKEAEECLKPKLLENKTKGFTRVGDYFFIETKEKFKQYDKLQFEKGNYEIIEHYGNTQAIEEIKKLIAEKFPENLDKDPNNINWIKMLEDLCNRQNWFLSRSEYSDKGIKEIIDKIIKEVKPLTQKGNLTRYSIYDSNHIADNSVNIGSVQLVKGFIYHKSREHRRIKLDTWHIVLKNEAIDSFNVSASGAYRD
jgi:hypothetical protein